MSDPVDHPHNWSDAIQHWRDDLECPKCHAQNRPGIANIEVDERGECLCTQCAEAGLPNHFQRRYLDPQNGWLE